MDYKVRSNQSFKLFLGRSRWYLLQLQLNYCMSHCRYSSNHLSTFPWQPLIGSPDFCAAAQHFIQAFSDAGISGVTTNANCELVAPTGGWPAVVTAINTAGCAGVAPIATANTCFFVRTTEPRKRLV